MVKNVKRKPGFKQVCIWPNSFVGPQGVEEFQDFMFREFGARVQYLEEIKTAPCTDSRGNHVPGTGGRNDLFFAVHTADLMAFALPRLYAGIRWVEDALSSINYRDKIYPGRVFRYRTWDGNPKPSELFDGSLVLKKQPENTANPPWDLDWRESVALFKNGLSSTSECPL